jgi:hypothetical protein
MKYKIPNNVRMVGVSLLVLVAIYGILSILIKTQEGLSDGAGNANAEIIKKTNENTTSTTDIFSKLPASTNAYVDLVNSYKNMRITQSISELVTNKSSPKFASISDYNEAIDYLKTLYSSGSDIDSSAITAQINENNATISSTLEKLTADNQAYIDLLISHKNLSIAKQLTGLATTSTAFIGISDCDHVIDYLNELSGPPISNPATAVAVPTTPEISLIKKN